MTSATDTHTVFCIPVFNDAQGVAMLLERLDIFAATVSHSFAVVLVDDGSQEEEFQALPGPTPCITKLEVLRLRRNLGHQRAIAIGLSYIAATYTADYVIVMDGDGEDCPSTLPHLLEAAIEGGRYQAVFAERLKRHDGPGFMLGYRTFRVLHKLFVGRDVRIGNFSVLPRPILERVVGISEIWNHYAAGVVHARIPLRLVPTARGRRLAGASKMNLPSLVLHGICALSVWSDVIVARLLLFIAGLMACALALLLIVVTSRLVANPFTPGWATTAASMLIVVTILLGVVSLLLGLFVLGSRSASNFLPHRDWRDYVLPASGGDPGS
jgi:hypothetical protein